MKILRIEPNINLRQRQKNVIDISFKNNKINEANIIKDDNGNEYVKVPKSKYNFNKWSWRILIGLIILDIIYLLLNTRKPEPWEDAYKIL